MPVGYFDQGDCDEGALVKMDVGDGEGPGAIGAIFVEDNIEVNFAGAPAGALFPAEFFFDLLEVVEQPGRGEVSGYGGCGIVEIGLVCVSPGWCFI